MNTKNIKQNGVVIANPNNEKIFKQYLKDIAKYKPLTREEEIETFKLVETGCRKSIEKICNHNLLFVVSIAKQYSRQINNTTLTLEDLICEGNVGLHNAVVRFNYRTGNKFISYAVWWIKSKIVDSIQTNIKTIRMPHSIRNQIVKLKNKSEKLEQKLCRVPSSIEILESMTEGEFAKTIDSSEKIDEILKMSQYERSLSELIGDEGTTDLSQILECEDPIAYDIMFSKERHEILNVLLDKIPFEVQEYLRDFFGLNGRKILTYKEIGEKYGLKPQAIRAKVEKALRKMRYKNISTGRFLFPR